MEKISSTIEALKRYINFLDKELIKAETKYQIKSDKEKNKIKMLLKEYQDENTVQEAYGYGFITANKREKLLELLKKSNGKEELFEADAAYIKILRNNIKEAEQEVRLEGNHE